MENKTRVAKLKQALKERILILDGAMGTMIQKENLTAKDFGKEEYDGCNEYLTITRPDVISKIHRLYLEAGADIIETNSFGATPLVLKEYNLEDQFETLNKKSAQLARSVADEFTTKNPNKTRFVAGSMGPTTKTLSLNSDISFDELSHQFYLQAKNLAIGGVDFFLVETCTDSLNIKAALSAIQKVNDELSLEIPIAISLTIEASGTMLAGQSPEAAIASFNHLDLIYIGINCATGPSQMRDHVRVISKMSNNPVSCAPNAGLPDENGNYLETPAMLAEVVAQFASSGFLNVVGGCCGTTPAHINAIFEAVKNISPRSLHKYEISYLSQIDFLEITNDKRPILVGERTNSIGSKKFRDLIAADKIEEAAEIAKSQIKTGADIIDICLANPDRNELVDMERFLKVVTKKIRVPIMIDSTDDKVIHKALTMCQGKAIINSINLEDGEKGFEKIVPLAKEFGAALVVGCIDDNKDDGMAKSRDRKLAIAKRSYDILVSKFKFPKEDIYFDPLVFPCATGDSNYSGLAIETIEGLRLIKKEFPASKSAIGLSNVSFGLPASGREVLNSVFLYHCTIAGLDLAIVNAEKLKRYATLSPEERTMAEDVLFNNHEDAVNIFTEYFRGKKSEQSKSNIENISVDKRIESYVIEGYKEFLIKDLDILSKSNSPLEIINGPLMNGMKEVGKLFNENKLIVAEVLQSAEVMKAAVDHLKQYMDKNSEAHHIGTMLLATVKGDVHDIGKNLVEIILSNNGFNVINLGIKISSDELIAAVNKYNPDMIGLSGLLVKSALQMESTAEDFSFAEIKTPIIVGGAALTRNFTESRIQEKYKSGKVYYAKDAMDGLKIALQIMNKN